jgi:ABC-2 type transport system ATP-binding protein
MIKVVDLVKKFGSLKAVDHVSMEVNHGEIVGFLGPNGAGKSTTMKIITCFQTPTSGTVTVCGHDITKDSMSVRKCIGYLPESAPSYSDMNVISFLKFIASIRGFNSAEAKKNIDRVIQICELENVLYKKIETLSKGFKQRTCFAQALLHDPKVLVLDEPTDGLDPNQKFIVRKLIRELGKNKTIILSTHILEEVDAVCDRAIIIANGKIVANGTPESLRQSSQHFGSVTITLKPADLEKAKSSLSNINTIKNIEVVEKEDKHLIMIYPNDKLNPITGQIIDASRNGDWQFTQIFTDQGRLEDVFRQLTIKS